MDFHKNVRKYPKGCHFNVKNWEIKKFSKLVELCKFFHNIFDASGVNFGIMKISKISKNHFK